MKLVLSLALMASAAAGPATAQPASASNPGMTAPNWTTDGLDKAAAIGLSATPTMRRLQLVRARNLRTEAAALQAADGGTLSAAHLAYLRRKVMTIRMMGE